MKQSWSNHSLVQLYGGNNSVYIYPAQYNYFTDVMFSLLRFFSFQGKWLYEKYGLPMKIIWGIGILAAGQSSTMTVS